MFQQQEGLSVVGQPALAARCIGGGGPRLNKFGQEQRRRCGEGWLPSERVLTDLGTEGMFN